MQLKGHVYSSVINALQTIGKEEGFRGFYKGMIPNAVKVNIYLYICSDYFLPEDYFILLISFIETYISFDLLN